MQLYRLGFRIFARGLLTLRGRCFFVQIRRRCSTAIPLFPFLQSSPPAITPSCSSSNIARISSRSSAVSYAIFVRHDAYGSAPDQVRIALLVTFCYTLRMASKNSGISVATRLNKQQYEKILKRRRSLKQQTGVELSVSAVLRLIVEEAPQS